MCRRTRRNPNERVTARDSGSSVLRAECASNFYDALETTGGKANLLASFALFRDDPTQINKALPLYDAVTAAQIQSVAQKYLVPTNRTSIDRVPAKEGK